MDDQTLQKILFMVAGERRRQDEKWGDQRDHSAERWLTILTEEVGEFAKAILEGCNPDEMIGELIQVAAVAVAAIESIEHKQES